MGMGGIGRASRAALAAIAIGVVAGCAGTGGSPQAGVQRLYAFNCGESKTTDLSRWAPDVPKGTPFEFSANCYLIRHARGLMLWDSGIPDSVATMPNGFVTGGGTLTYRLPKPFRAQLAEIGVSPEQVTHIAFSHTHGDHVGNANLFTRATLFIQQAEHDAAFGPDASKYGFQPANYGKLRDNPTVPLRGDHDVFGDGSVVILSTPGHTPGHQSLLVRLPRTGAVVLSGDMVHTRENWERRRIPGMNVDKAQSAQSMEKIARILEEQRATLWINHDKVQSAGIPRAPAYVE